MLHWLRRLTTPHSRKPAARTRYRFRPAVERLEDRAVPAGFPFVMINGANLLPMVLDDANLPGIAGKFAGLLPTVTATLAAASDTSPLGDLRTNLNLVSIFGQTSPNAGVRLLQNGGTTTADATGQYTLNNVPLSDGPNNFTIQATGANGYFGQTTLTLSRNRAPVLDRALVVNPVTEDDPDTILSLDKLFRDTDAVLRNSVVRFDTTEGVFDVRLLDSAAPRTVANFLGYVNTGDYNESVFHRLVSNFVLQGGGFTFVGDGARPENIPEDPPVINEFGMPNTRGTIAMAKVGPAPGQLPTPATINSATTEFFFNLANNTTTLGPTNNGGFTVFGTIEGAAGLQVLDQLAAIPTPLTGVLPTSDVFREVPLKNFPAGNAFPADAVEANFAIINSVVLTQRSDGMAFAVIDNTNPGVVNAVITGSTLTLQYLPGQSGTAVITIQATDQEGLTSQTTVSITVEPAEGG